LAHSETDTRRLAVHLLFVIVLAAMVAGCRSTAEDAAARVSPGVASSTTATTAPATSTAPASTTSTTLRYGLLGEEVAVSESALGTVTWWHVPSLPLELLWETDFPGPGYSYGYEFERIDHDARTAAGHCLQIHDMPSGYLGMGPCPNYWKGQGNETGGWFAPFDHPWMRDIEVWFSVDGADWELKTDTAFGPSAAVMADPFVVAEYDDRWLVLGWVDVERQSDLTEEKCAVEWCDPPRVPMGDTPAAWISDDLVTWIRLPIDFTKPGTDTWLTSVAAGDPGWVIFGMRRSDEEPRTAEWAGWASTDGVEWEELPMEGLYDDPCRPLEFEHCGRIQAHVIEDAIVVYAWTYDTPADPPFGGNGNGWALFIGEL
jgi:hypothetical protein